MTRLLFATIILFALISQTIFAQGDLYPDDARVLARLTENGGVVNLSHIYGSPVNISYIVPTTSFQINFDGNLVTIDYEKSVKEAINEWVVMINKVNPKAQISFTQSESTSDANISFMVSLNPPSSLKTKARTYFNKDSANKGAKSLVFYPNNVLINIRSKLHYYIGIGIFPASMTTQELFNIYLKTILKHEIGHVLGLTHPELIALEIWCTDNVARRAIGFPMISAPPYPTRPGILMARIDNYFEQLRLFLGRPIGIDDVSMTENEAIAVSRLLNGDAQSTSPQNTSLAYQENAGYNAPIPLVDAFSVTSYTA